MYCDPHLFDPEQFATQLRDAQSPIAVFRSALKQANRTLRDRFYSSLSAREAVTQRAWLIDQVLVQAWNLHPWPKAEPIALVAVGGYGRAELHPASDIDILILFRDELSPQSKNSLEQFLTFLWDIGLQVGQGVRSLAECRSEAANDVTVMTNLLEARLLVGSRLLFESMQQITAPEHIWPSKEFFEAKLKEQQARHRRYHDTEYNLEPNIKDGPGNLRDIQTIAWVAKRHFGTNDLHELVYQGFLTGDEYDTLAEAQEFLWSIRCLLHASAGRREDRLLFDYQRSLANIFGHKDAPSKHKLGVEKLMKRYYRTVKKVSTLNEMLLQLFQEAILHGGEPKQITPLNQRFQVCNKFIEVRHEKVFSEHPLALLEIFLLVQQNPSIQGIRASTVRLILRYKYLIDKPFRADLRSRSLFLEILRQPSGQTRAFRQMSRYGVLAAYLPEFGKIVGQMQYDLFHAYTVDQHTLFVFRNVRRLRVPEHSHELPLCSELMQNLYKPELLYLAALFHDIGKGRGGDHSKLGAVDAVNFCLRHGLSAADARLVGWLVANHLLMSVTAQRQDTSDPEVVYNFLRQVEDRQHLDYLYLLTVADIRGTNPNLWNAWKAALLADFYYKTRHALQEGKQRPLDKQKQVEQVQNKTLQLLEETQRAPAQALWREIQGDYFLRSQPADIARETQAILQANEHQPLVMLRADARGGTEFLLYARNHEQLFVDSAFYLEQQGMNIVDAYIMSMDNGVTLIIYTLLKDDNTPIKSLEEAAALQQGLLHNISAAQPKHRTIRRLTPRQNKHFSIPTQVSFSRSSTGNYSVMEVITTDRPGLLYQIAQVLLACDIRLKSAKIATFGSKAEDVFYITDADDKPLLSPDQYQQLRHGLVQALEVGFEPPPTLIEI